MWINMFFERHFGQVGAGKGDFVIGSLSMYLIQRFNALLRLCAKKWMLSLFRGAGVGEISFNKLVSWSASAIFILIVHQLHGFHCSHCIVKKYLLSIEKLEYVESYDIMYNNDE